MVENTILNLGGLNLKTKNIYEKEFLKSYDPDIYEKPAVTVDDLIFRVMNEKLQILLIKRGSFPYKGKWAIPGGFINMNESLIDAAKRKLKEETGVENVYLEQLYTFGDVKRDPRTRVISVAYFALLSPPDVIVKAGNDAKEAEFFDITYRNNEIIFSNYNRDLEFNCDSLAFDHKNIIVLALNRVKNKVMYTDIALQLVKNKNKFTIYEIKGIYELLLHKQLDLSNFRKYFIREYIQKGKVSEAGKTRSTAKRMCKCYRIAERNTL